MIEVYYAEDDECYPSLLKRLNPYGFLQIIKRDRIN